MTIVGRAADDGQADEIGAAIRGGAVRALRLAESFNACADDLEAGRVA